MTVSAVTERTRTNTTFRAVFAVRDWRTLWFARVLSIAGDQFARVAVTVLVYDRTGSALLAALAFAASVVPVFVGGLTLGWVADKYRRRTVMICCDLISLALVLAMAIPGMPLAALVALLFLVTLAFSPFMAARAATNREVSARTGSSWGTRSR
jgi:MFS family permease